MVDEKEFQVLLAHCRNADITLSQVTNHIRILTVIRRLTERNGGKPTQLEVFVPYVATPLIVTVIRVWQKSFVVMEHTEHVVIGILGESLNPRATRIYVDLDTGR
jgi:hypothetical protein